MVDPINYAPIEVRMAHDKIGFYAGETITGTVMIDRENGIIKNGGMENEVRLSLKGLENCPGKSSHPIIDMEFLVAKWGP